MIVEIKFVSKTCISKKLFLTMLKNSSFIKKVTIIKKTKKLKKYEIAR